MNAIEKSSMYETRTDPGLLACEVCMKEIPISEASNSEATDYVIYYFGIECFGTWLKNR